METIIWRGHSTQTFKRLHEFFCNQSLCDVSLIAQDGTTFKAHQLLLAINSSFFHWIFHGWRETNEQVTEFKTDIDSHVLGALLGLIYNGELNIPSGWSWKEKILQAATTLQLSFLVEALRDEQCQTHVTGRIPEGAQTQATGRIPEGARRNDDPHRVFQDKDSSFDAPPDSSGHQNSASSVGQPVWKPQVLHPPSDATNLPQNPAASPGFHSAPGTGYPSHSSSIGPDQHDLSTRGFKDNIPYVSSSKHAQTWSPDGPQSKECHTTASSLPHQIPQGLQAYSSLTTLFPAGNTFHPPSSGSQTFPNFHCLENVNIQKYPDLSSSNPTNIQGRSISEDSGDHQQYSVGSRRVEQSYIQMLVPRTSHEQSLVKPQISRTSQEPQVSRTSQDPQVSRTSQDPQVSRTSQDPQVSRTSQDPQVPRTSQDPQVPNTSQDPQVSRTSQEPQVPRTLQELPPVDQTGTLSPTEQKTRTSIQQKLSSEPASCSSFSSSSKLVFAESNMADYGSTSMPKTVAKCSASFTEHKECIQQKNEITQPAVIIRSDPVQCEDKATSTRHTPMRNMKRKVINSDPIQPIVNKHRTRSMVKRECNPPVKYTSSTSGKKTDTIEEDQSRRKIVCSRAKKSGKAEQPSKPKTRMRTKLKRTTRRSDQQTKSRVIKRNRKIQNPQSNLSQRNLKIIARRKFMKSICVKYNTVRQLKELFSGLHMDMGDRPFLCSPCNKHFKRYSCWRLHALTEHVPSHRPRGTEQESVSRGPPGGKRKRERSGGESLECTECGSTYSLRKTLKFHLMQVHHMSLQQVKTNSRLLIKCEVSDCYFASIDCGEVERHMKTEHPQVKYRCCHCRRPRVFRLRAMLDKHVAKVHADRLGFSCSRCSLQFVKYVHQQEHERDQHGIQHSVKLFRCDVDGCDYETVRRFFLEKHQTLGHREHKCPHCNITVKTEDNLQTHINTMHLNIRPFLCDICGMGFAKDPVLRMHMKTKHDQKKEYKCRYCPYATNVHWYLANHVFHRHGIKADFDSRKILSCPHCSAKYLTNSYLQKHLRNVHDLTYKCTCDVCGKSYKSYSAMSTHKKVHQDVEQKCGYCRYSSKTGEHMKLHVRTQHTFKGVKPYLCPYCSYCSALGGNVRKHVIHKHPGKDVSYNTDKEKILYMQVTEAQMTTESGSHEKTS